MCKTKRTRCPYCKKITIVDVQKELDDHRRSVFGGASNQKISTPQFITIGCSCKEVYKIDISQ